MLARPCARRRRAHISFCLSAVAWYKKTQRNHAVSCGHTKALDRSTKTYPIFQNKTLFLRARIYRDHKKLIHRHYERGERMFFLDEVTGVEERKCLIIASRTDRLSTENRGWDNMTHCYPAQFNTSKCILQSALFRSPFSGAL